jgi:hypothetical protein
MQYCNCTYGDICAARHFIMRSGAQSCSFIDWTTTLSGAEEQAMVNRDRRVGIGNGTRRFGLLVSAVLLIAAWGPRVALADCCNCTFDLGPPTGVVAFCQSTDLSTCPTMSEGFNCDRLTPGGTCTLDNNQIGGVCNAPTPSSTPTETSTPTATGTATATATQTPTPTPVPNGGACASNDQCVSLLCVDGVCAAQSPAPAVSNRNVVFLAAGLLLAGFWSVRRLGRRQ